MHRFYSEECPEQGSPIALTPEDSAHALRVLRLEPGDEVELLGGGQRWQGQLIRIESGLAVILPHTPLPTTEPALRITLYQGLPKADKMDWIVQKAVELGAARIVPVAMQRSVVKLNPRDGEKKQQRWQRIAREAGKQSGRCMLPQVAQPLSFTAMCAELQAGEQILVPWEEAAGYSLRAFAGEHPAVRELGLVIGPEGGITPEEIETMRRAGAAPVTLGPRILRTETAGLAALSALYALYGEME